MKSVKAPSLCIIHDMELINHWRMSAVYREQWEKDWMVRVEGQILLCQQIADNSTVRAKVNKSAVKFKCLIESSGCLACAYPVEWKRVLVLTTTGLSHAMDVAMGRSYHPQHPDMREKRRKNKTVRR